ncbi:hypothetical protein MHYP_G00341770 [Metynnis hypsauchen]
MTRRRHSHKNAHNSSVKVIPGSRRRGEKQIENCIHASQREIEPKKDTEHTTFGVWPVRAKHFSHMLLQKDCAASVNSSPPSNFDTSAETEMAGFKFRAQVHTEWLACALNLARPSLTLHNTYEESVSGLSAEQPHLRMRCRNFIPHHDELKRT